MNQVQLKGVDKDNKKPEGEVVLLMKKEKRTRDGRGIKCGIRNHMMIACPNQ